MTNPIDTIKSLIRDVPDFPKPGILFKDITPLIGNAEGLSATLNLMADPFVGQGITRVVGMESRGFIFGVSVAERLGAGFVPIRKPGKLPYKTHRQSYALEYGTDNLEIHADAVSKNDKVLIVDDLLATGGTAEAAVKLVRSLGAEVVGISFVIELAFLNGRDKLKDINVKSLLTY
jgi:adenine phosphoribosyltransferase